MRFEWKENTARRIAVLSAMLALLCAVAPVGRPQPPTALPQSRPAPASFASANFAVADFDGDRKPDLATVEMERSASTGDARYSIRFKLATGDTQVFGVTAPAGGLQLVARDVNGDDALDLLVSTAWQHQQVAVFLNDGHGNFTPARPEAFSAWLSDVEHHWVSEPLPRGDSAALPGFQSQTQGEAEHSRKARAAQQVGLAEPATCRGRSPLFLFSLLGRAPPAASHQA